MIPLRTFHIIFQATLLGNPEREKESSAVSSPPCSVCSISPPTSPLTFTGLQSAVPAHLSPQQTTRKVMEDVSRRSDHRLYATNNSVVTISTFLTRYLQKGSIIEVMSDNKSCTEVEPYSFFFFFPGFPTLHLVYKMMMKYNMIFH